MEDKLSKGGNNKRLKKGSKPECGNSGPENFVHPLYKISGSAPAMVSEEKMFENVDIHTYIQMT